MINLSSKRRWLKMPGIGSNFVAGIVERGKVRWLKASRSGGRFVITTLDELSTDPKKLAFASPSDSDAIEAALAKGGAR